MQLVFDRLVTKKTPGEFRTRVIQEGVHPSLHIEYKNFDLKQYFKEGRGCRTEGTFRNPKDFGVNKGLSNLPYPQKIGREINRRLLEVERVSHNSGLSGDSIQRVVQPTVTDDGEKAPALKFGQPRVMALFMALTLFQHLIDLRLAAAIRMEGRSPVYQTRSSRVSSRGRRVHQQRCCAPLSPASIPQSRRLATG